MCNLNLNKKIFGVILGLCNHIPRDLRFSFSQEHQEQKSIFPQKRSWRNDRACTQCFQWGTFTFPQCCCWHCFQITGCTSFSPLPIPEEFISVSCCMFSAPFCLGFFILHGPSNCWDTQDCRARSVWAVGFPHLCWSLEGVLTCLIFMRWLHLHYLFVTFRDAGKDLSLFEAGILQSVRKRETRGVSQRALILTWWFGFSVRTSWGMLLEWEEELSSLIEMKRNKKKIYLFIG